MALRHSNLSRIRFDRRFLQESDRSAEANQLTVFERRGQTECKEVDESLLLGCNLATSGPRCCGISFMLRETRRRS